MPCTFLALFADAATARRATHDLSAVAGVDRAYQPADVDALVEQLGVTPHEARELREGTRRGERIVVIEIWSADQTACDILEALRGARLLIRAEHPPDAPPRAEQVYRPRPAIESIRSDLYIG